MKQKKLKVLDLFAGAGGFGLGFKMNKRKYKLIASLERDKWAVETLRANNITRQKIIHKDIQLLRTAKQILAVSPSKPNVIIGGPPCQGFSHASRARDPKDPRNSLFKYFVKWVKVLQPQVFVMENVKGLLTGKNSNGENVIEIIKESFKSLGYSLDVWELNAANYGVPQNRERIFIVGNNLNITIPEPPITHFLPIQRKKLNGKAKTLKRAISVINAISDLPGLKAGEGQEKVKFETKPQNEFQRNSRKATSTLHNHVSMVHTKRVVKRYQKILEGINISKIPKELRVLERNGNGNYSKSNYRSNYRHLKPNMISYTIPASFYSNFIHPKQPRNITSREAARLQSFPDHYVFKGKRTQISSSLLKQLGKHDENHLSQYNQIGNAVPPLLAKSIANQIAKILAQVEKVKSKAKKQPKKF